MRNVAPKGLIPLVRAIPFTIAPMACSRMPKWKFRPLLPVAVNDAKLFRFVFVEGARSAEPPMKLGSFAARSLITLPEASRVDRGLSVALKEGKTISQPLGRSPLM